MSVDANALERETLERKDRDELQKIAGALGGKVTSRTRKADIIDQILELTGVTSSAAEAPEAPAPAEPEKPAAEPETTDRPRQERPRQEAPADEDTGRESVSARRKQGNRQGESSTADQEATPADQGGQSGQAGDEADTDGDAGGKRRRRRGRNREAGPQQDEYTGEPIPVVGCLDLRDDGYGFLRVDGMLPSKDDCYVSVKQVRQFGLRKGDVVAGGSRPAFRNEKNPAILRIDTVNDVALEPGQERPLFEDLAAVFPTEQIALTLDDEPDDRTTRAVDLLAPMGKGQRVLLLGAPRTGKTTTLQAIARSVEANEPDATLLVVLLDERPEEITEMERFVTTGTVHGTAFDADASDHVAVLELALARAKRLAEAGDDVVVLVDGLTRLARAEHASGQSVGRSLGGLDLSAIQSAKRAFGAGRNLEEAGSVTVVATANVDTDSAVDQAVVDAVVGAATSQIRLDRFAAERRAFPPLDVGGTSTRREDLLVGDDGAEQREVLRRSLAGLPDGESPDHADPLDRLISRLRETKSNAELLAAAASRE